jgi:hypothetical protein
MVDLGRIDPKYIQAVSASWVVITGFSANGGTGNITSALTTALTTAGRGGSAVDLAVSSGEDDPGVIATNPKNYVPIRQGSAQLQNADGIDIYARITEATGTYTLTYYVNDAGSQTPYSFGGATSIDLYIPYRFTFGTRPGDADISFAALGLDTSVNPTVTVPTAFSEELTVGTNTLSDLTHTPIGAVTLICSGVGFSSVESPAPFTVSGKSLTWSASNAGVSLDSNDTVVASYFY